MATRQPVSTGLGLFITSMTEHDLLEVVEIEEISGISVWGWDAYHRELQSPEDVIMLVARTATAKSNQTDGQAIAGFIISRLVAGELYINKLAGGTEGPRAGIGVKTFVAGSP